MHENTLWHRASQINIQTGPHVSGGFDIGFDQDIPESIRAELTAFVHWAEDHFRFPVTLWVDFEYKHYLLDRNRKRSGYLFYWADFSSYPIFEDGDDIPVLRLPVRTERHTAEEILASFIEGISCYFAWLSNRISDDFTPDEEETGEILQTFLHSFPH